MMAFKMANCQHFHNKWYSITMSEPLNMYLNSIVDVWKKIDIDDDNSVVAL